MGGARQSGNKGVSGEKVEGLLRSILSREGYGLSSERAWGETGVDIIASRGREQLWVEVIGYKPNGPARAKDFYEAFFRAVSRLNEGAREIVIAMPDAFRRGLPARISRHRVAWERIGKAFPELSIWLLDLDCSAVERIPWLAMLAYDWQRPADRSR